MEEHRPVVPDKVGALEEACTRTRTLETATRLFKERGFSAVSIRDIAQESGSHLSAVNYHFRNKENLWEEALRYSFRWTTDQVATLEALLKEARQSSSPEDLLAILGKAVQRLLDDFLLPERDSGSLLLWEMVSNGPHLEMIIREYIRPTRLLFGDIIQLLLPAASPRQLELYVSSIVGLCVNARQSLPVLMIVFNCSSREECIELIGSQTVEFCLNAMRGYMRQADAVSDAEVK